MALAWGLVERAERDRTAAQIATVHDALLGDDHRDYEELPEGGYRILSVRPRQGVWATFTTSRSVDELLRDLRTAALSASLDEPSCVRSSERDYFDRIWTRASVPWNADACDLSRDGDPFGRVEIALSGTSGTSSVTVGIGPETPSYRLRDLLEMDPEEPLPRPVFDPSLLDLLRASARPEVLLVFAVAVAVSTGATSAAYAIGRRRPRRRTP
ncbi:hypothetical protein [Cellulomonas triticagri]|uniref:hypothetical protein n=1 Tax=Cellulomonas triticagri TaxID=2483352 RepID=UPI0011C3A79B|nr:hypothetical protein [Cellulomonas triticagri]